MIKGSFVKTLGMDNCPDFFYFIDSHYHEQWNSDLASSIKQKYNIEISTKQLRGYARKFNLTKKIDNVQKTILLINRYNSQLSPDVTAEVINFLLKHSQSLTNQQVKEPPSTLKAFNPKR